MCQMMESSVKNFVVIFAAMIFPHIAAYPNGLVTVACGTMVPNHGAEAQTSVPPYSLSVSKQNYTAGESITVILSANAGVPALRGFLIQARAGSNTSPLGTFTTSGTEAQLLTCNKAADASYCCANSDNILVECCQSSAYVQQWNPSDTCFKPDSPYHLCTNLHPAEELGSMHQPLSFSL